MDKNSPERIAKLTVREAAEFHLSLEPEWKIDGETLVRLFTFPDFHDAMAFTNRVAEIAEALNHHPEICVSYGKAIVRTSTHDVSGLSEKDFMLAKKIDALGVGIGK